MRGDIKTTVLCVLSGGPADSDAIGRAIRRSKPQTNAVLAWMLRRGYVIRVRDGVPGRFGFRPSVWAAKERKRRAASLAVARAKRWANREQITT